MTHYSICFLLSSSRNGKFLSPSNPLDQSAPWVSEDGEEKIEAEVIQEDMTRIGAELALLQISKNLTPTTFGFSSNIHWVECRTPSHLTVLLNQY